MLEHCDFLTQATTDADGQNQRPDVLVQLVGNKSIIVDSKVPLEAYLDAIAEEDPAKREEQMRRHARHVRTHMDQLSAKAYWRSLPATPEYVVLFIPGESMLADALSADPELLVHAANKNVMLAGPVSLILMLRTAQHAWREDALARDARKVLDEGQALYQRLASLGEHLNKIGKGLASTVKAYNDSVGSIEKSVLPSARRLQSLKVADADPVEPKPMDEPLRTIAAPELTAAIAASERPVSLVGDSDEFIGLADELSIAEPISKDGTTGR
jgi:DNA recombination protein RmuC